MEVLTSHIKHLHYYDPEETKLTATLHGVILTSTLQTEVFNALRNPVTEYGMALIILFNMVIIIIDTDQASADPDGGTDWTATSGNIILLVFIVELVMRLYALRKGFWKDTWNKFDFIVVVSDASFSLFGFLFGDMFEVSVLRVFRLAKLARMTKVVRMFPELRELVAGLVGAFRAIFWGMVLLTFALLVWSIIAVQFIHPLNKEMTEKGLHDGCERCPRAFSSVMNSFLTFSQQIICGDSWGQATIPIIEYAPHTSVFFAAVFLSVGLAIVNLILGVVVTVAQEAHDLTRKDHEDEKRMAVMESQNHLMSMCADMDADGSGELTREEIEKGFRDNKAFRDCLLEMDVEEDGLSIVWTILDSDKSGVLNFKEFVSQIYKMRDSDSQFMLAYIRYYITLIRDNICDLMMKQTEEAQEQAQRLEKELLDTEAEVLADLGQKPRLSARQSSKEASAKEEKALLDDKCEAKSPLQDFGNINSADIVAGLGEALQAKDGESSLLVTRPESDSAAAEQGWKEVLDNAKVFQNELKETVRDAQRSLELQGSSLSKLLFELLQKSSDDLLAVPPVVSHGCLPTPVCCKHSPTITKTLVLQTNAASGLSVSSVMSPRTSDSLPRLGPAGNNQA